MVESGESRTYIYPNIRGNVTTSTENRYVDEPLKGYDHITVGEFVVLAVSDDESGISSDDLERIFEPFYTKKVMGRSGTGLGLALAWNVVQDHNGYIDVTSKPYRPHQQYLTAPHLVSTFGAIFTKSLTHF